MPQPGDRRASHSWERSAYTYESTHSSFPRRSEMMGLTSHLETIEERDDLIVPDVAIVSSTMLVALQEQVVE